jgi:AP2 domain
MTSLNIIEQFLNIQIGNKRLMKGKNDEEKNKYYFFANRYYIVSLPNEKWIIMTTNNQTRDFLTNHIWRNNEGYSMTTIEDHTKKLHRLLLDCPNHMKVDHINRRPFDNRVHNLRIVTQKMNDRNRKKPMTNTSGFMGVCKNRNSWVSTITDNNNNKISKCFSIKRHGDNEAKQMAINQRLIWKQQYNYLGE